MKALIDGYKSEKTVIDKVKNPRELLNELYDKNETYDVTFYKRAYGTTTECATVTFTNPYTVTLRYQILTIAEQKQFIGFITDHLSKDLYKPPYNLVFLD